MSNYFKGLRIQWIGDMLDVYGFINRGHLMRKFDISGAQAAIDFKEAKSQFPDKMEYDISRKCYFNPSAKIYLPNFKDGNHGL